MSRANRGRVAAARALVGVDEGGHVEDLLREHSPPKGPDRGLAWHLALGTLRWRGAIDQALAPHLKRPIDSLDPGVRGVLRMGLFEIHKSRTPARAAVHQAVEVCKAIGLKRASGLVNAVLRRSAESSLSEDPSAFLPAWLFARWKDYPAWLVRLREPARISICGVPPEAIAVSASMLGTETIKDLWTLDDNVGDIAALDGFAEGRFWVMDPAAAKVADLVYDALDGEGSVLDACAAPGGKTFRMISRGLDVVGCDRSPDRLDLMAESLHRLTMDVNLSCHDWLEGPHSDLGDFDAVLVDAPCTGLGVVRRHPEIPWRRQPGDPAAMGISQRRILKHASQHVKAGGALIYAVCSTEPEEGVQVAESVEGWQIDTRWASVPPQGDEDGFQAFVLRRVGA